MTTGLTRAAAPAAPAVGSSGTLTVLLADAGLAVTTGPGGSLELVGTAGRGRLATVGDGTLRVRFEPRDLPSDPLALARLAAAVPEPLRLVRRRCQVLIEGVGTRDEIAAAVLELVRADHADRAAVLPVVELVVGVLAVTVPALDIPSFLRLAPPASDDGAEGASVDRARATLVLAANADLRVARAAWIDGPGLIVEPGAVPRPGLTAEVRTMHDGLCALADRRIAATYLELSGLSKD